MEKLMFEILGKPIGKARPRISRWGTYTPNNTVNYENFVKLCFMEKYKDFKPLETNLKVTILAIFEVPKSYSNKKKKELLGQPHNKKPDIDNVTKSILDALNKIAFKDDNQVTHLDVKKVYGPNAKVIVQIKEIN